MRLSPSPLKRLDIQRRNLARRRVATLCNTWAGSFVDGGHCCAVLAAHIFQTTTRTKPQTEREAK